jgi:hypothetical protein
MLSFVASVQRAGACGLIVWVTPLLQNTKADIYGISHGTPVFVGPEQPSD